EGLRWCQAASIRRRRTWLLPVFVIAPCRRRSPLECSLGVRPRNGPSDSGRNRCQSPSSTVNANAVSVETPRRQTSRLTTSTYGGAPASSAIALSSASRLVFVIGGGFGGSAREDVAHAVVFEGVDGERWFAPHLVEPADPP